MSTAKAWNSSWPSDLLDESFSLLTKLFRKNRLLRLRCVADSNSSFSLYFPVAFEKKCRLRKLFKGFPTGVLPACLPRHEKGHRFLVPRLRTASHGWCSGTSGKPHRLDEVPWIWRFVTWIFFPNIHTYISHTYISQTVYRLFTVSYWMGVSFVPSLHLLFVYLVRAGGFRILEGSWKVWESSPAVTEMLEVPVRILRKPPSQNPFNLWKISIAPVLPFRKLDCSHAKQLFCWLQGFPSMLLREG